MATITIKNLPDQIYARLTRIARENRRSINSEAIVTLERGLEFVEPSTEDDLLARIRRNREEMKNRGIWVADEEITAAKNEGRP